MAKIPDISIVVPVFNSEKIIPELVKRIYQTMNKARIAFEVVMVNDASTDNSAKVLDVYQSQYENFKVIHNLKNLGQAFTSIKGIANTQGEYIVTIDDDLEYEPSDILKLYDTIKTENCDVVFGLAPDKYKKQGKSPYIAKLRNKVLNFIWDKPVTDSFKIFKRSFVFEENAFLLAVPFEVFLKRNRKAIQIEYIKVNFNKRFAGQSNYTIIKKLRLFFEMNKYK